MMRGSKYDELAFEHAFIQLRGPLLDGVHDIINVSGPRVNQNLLQLRAFVEALLIEPY
jgi:hypothetical protein